MNFAKNTIYTTYNKWKIKFTYFTEETLKKLYGLM